MAASARKISCHQLRFQNRAADGATAARTANSATNVTQMTHPTTV